MKKPIFSLLRKALPQVIALSGVFIATGVQADDTLVGWIDNPKFESFTIIRDGHKLKNGQADLQACDIVQLTDSRAIVHITLSSAQRVQLDAKVPGLKIKVPCDEKPRWHDKPLAVLRAIALLATAPVPALATDIIYSEQVAATRGVNDSPRLAVPALGNYAPMLVAGERSLYLTWHGGVPPYRVSMKQYGGSIVIQQDNIGATFVRLPRMLLLPGRYVLRVEGSDKHGIEEDSITVVDAARLPPPPIALAEATLAKADRELLYAYYLEGWGKGEWTLEALQRAAAIDPATPVAREWLVRRFFQEGLAPIEY